MVRPASSTSRVQDPWRHPSFFPKSQPCSRYEGPNTTEMQAAITPSCSLKVHKSSCRHDSRNVCRDSVAGKLHTFKRSVYFVTGWGASSFLSSAFLWEGCFHCRCQNSSPCGLEVRVHSNVVIWFIVKCVNLLFSSKAKVQVSSRQQQSK